MSRGVGDVTLAEVLFIKKQILNFLFIIYSVYVVYFAYKTVSSWKLKKVQEFLTFVLQTLYVDSYKQLNTKTTAKTSLG